MQNIIIILIIILLLYFNFFITKMPKQWKYSHPEILFSTQFEVFFFFKKEKTNQKKICATNIFIITGIHFDGPSIYFLYIELPLYKWNLSLSQFKKRKNWICRLKTLGHSKDSYHAECVVWKCWATVKPFLFKYR